MQCIQPILHRDKQMIIAEEVNHRLRLGGIIGEMFPIPRAIQCVEQPFPPFD